MNKLHGDMKFLFMKNEIKRLKCIDMSAEGLGICKDEGLVIFVKGLIEGEEADVKIIKEKKNYSIGIIEKLITSSKHRIESECNIAYKCGGCDFRHIDYEYQLKIKKNILNNTLKGYQVKDITADDNPYYYRNKIQVPCRNNKMGFYRKNSNDIVEFDDCLLESELANDIIKDLKEMLDDEEYKYLRHIIIKHGKVSNEIMLGFVVNDFNCNFNDISERLCLKYPEIKSIILNLNTADTNVILGEEEKLLYGRDYIYDYYDGIKIKLSLKSFYQVNHDQMLKLYALVEKLGNPEGKRVLDLYCGIGTISLYLARKAKEVTGVEIVESAISNAIENAKMNNIDNIEFVLADASKNMNEYIKDKDLIVVDPPRKGISKELINSFIELQSKEIVYVSCNPATLKRDLDLLAEYYDISEIYPVDMFGFTVHVECVCKLTYKERR